MEDVRCITVVVNGKRSWSVYQLSIDFGVFCDIISLVRYYNYAVYQGDK